VRLQSLTAVNTGVGSDGIRAGRPGFDSQRGKIFLFCIASRPTLGPTQPSIQWLPGVKRPGREADHTPPSSVEVKNGGAIPPFHHVFMA
jgi:hypothetical protein